MRSVASSGIPPKSATSRESRPRQPRPNLPPAPSTSRQVRPSRVDEDDDASSEPDIKMHQESLKQWAMEQPSVNVKQDNPQTRLQSNNVNNLQPHGNPKPDSIKKEPTVVNHVHETESELIFEKSEELQTADKMETVHPVEDFHDFSKSVIKKKTDTQIAQPKGEKSEPSSKPSELQNNGTIKSDE
ncbi:unnamed protein product [Bursaphelenchus xylophilus]|uniref:(pine wood nematode) hypothetical protein n=1 Tax=Bursaphelenchus xylophilus TaxID=6326 RepID=A0A1I7STK4_BURXY|nr:unnamed protein product [Bursaphelenchus xylophilus]CAG9108297.1 unnamed protein product [Bursaphelenchus xylophilus]